MTKQTEQSEKSLKYNEGMLLSGDNDVKILIARYRATGWTDMDPEQRAFVMAYCETYSHAKAAKQINKSKKWGLKTIRNPLVLAMIEDIQNSFLELNIITENFVRQKWIELLPKLMGEEKINMITGTGAKLQAKKFHPSESVAVLRELGRSTKDFYKSDPISDFASSLREAMAQPGSES